MFTNIGSKIQVLGKVLCWIGIAFCILTGILLIAGGSMFSEYYSTSNVSSVVTGILVMVIGSVISWASSFMMIGFGKIVQCAEQIADNTKKDN